MKLFKLILVFSIILGINVLVIWAGVGILGVSIIGMVFFKEPYSHLKLVSILLIVVGVIALNISDILLHK